jgi:tRNA pseudouridine38-40 synthase
MTNENRGEHPQRFKLGIEFDGGRYSGWQQQTDARTVQGSLLQAAAALFGGEVDIQGSGRTDAGVHALDFTAHLHAVTGLSPHEIKEKMNKLLPRDIVIRDCKRAGARFHARHHCIGRSYCYQIAPQKIALGRNFVWSVDGVDGDLNGEKMQAAASILVGMHDFTSFTDRQTVKKKSPLVMVHQCQVVRRDVVVLVRVVGSHFLWKMVRRLVGVLAAVGKGELTPDEVRGFLQTPVSLAHLTAPAQGLFFERAFYDQEELTRFIEKEELGAIMRR